LGGGGSLGKVSETLCQKQNAIKTAGDMRGTSGYALPCSTKKKKEKKKKKRMHE
jgi:hypothetical protein